MSSLDKNRKFREENKGLFLACDLLVTLMILVNLGSVAVTKYLLTEEKQEMGEGVDLKEQNPAAAEVHNMSEENTTDKSFWKQLFLGSLASLFRQGLLWGLLLGVYLLVRFRISEKIYLGALVLFCSVYVVIHAADLASNLGYLVALV